MGMASTSLFGWKITVQNLTEEPVTFYYRLSSHKKDQFETREIAKLRSIEIDTKSPLQCIEEAVAVIKNKQGQEDLMASTIFSKFFGLSGCGNKRLEIIHRNPYAIYLKDKDLKIKVK